jgi:DNA-binding IclR family transcriptional regulator
MSETVTQVKSAQRVLDLFELLAPWRRGMSHSQIADALSIPKSSLTQLLKSLTTRGYVTYNPTDKTYSLGDRFAALTRLTAGHKDMITLCQPVLEELTRRTKESSALNLLNGDMAEVVATVLSPQRLLSHMRTGDAAPLYATSGGKVILAFLSDSMREDYLSRVKFQPITANTISSVPELMRQLDKIRRDGVAYSFEEFTAGIVGMAKAVLSSSAMVLGSVNVAVPVVRYNSKLDDLVTDALGEAVAMLQKLAEFP